MKHPRPGTLAVRAVNQYRRRDVIAYLGLRYYLHSTAARTDHWARQVATDLVMTRTDHSYFSTPHFKEVNEDGDPVCRMLYLPGANEIMAETALLAECASRPESFANLACVFSYELSQDTDRPRVFRQYMDGLRARQEDIASACDDCLDGVVQYTDLRRFYPSIEADLALRAWQKHAESANLPGLYRDLGEKLIHDHNKSSVPGGKGILTGPMFSHFLANLVLRELDEEFSQQLPARYFRYVDDITLVGEKPAVRDSLATLRGRLGDLGLTLHDEASPKHMKVDVAEWLKGRHDFRDSRRVISWPTFIGDLRLFLLLSSGEREHLQQAFRDEGFRIPIFDYSNAVREPSYLEKVRQWASRRWFRRKSRAVSINTLLDQARWLQKSFLAEFHELIDEISSIEGGHRRKRLVPRLRYRASRLIYLAPDDTLAALTPLAEKLTELYYHAKVMEAVANGNIDSVLPLGTNAAQAVAQPLKAANKKPTLTRQSFSENEEMALATFFLNGIPPASVPEGNSELLHFARYGADLALMKSTDPAMRELACLHGITAQPRHPEVLETAFDEDEELAMDAIEQLQQSYAS